LIATATFIQLSYGSAAVAFAVLTVVLVVSREHVLQGQRVLLAVGGTAGWGAVIAAGIVFQPSPLGGVAYIADAGRAVLWILCLLAAFPGEGRLRAAKRAVSAGVLSLAVAAFIVPFITGGTRAADLTMLGLTTIGCLTVEQIFRNSTPEHKRVLKPFLWTIGGMFMYDLFVFADATLFASLDPLLWAPRGFISAIAVPFFVLSAKRHPDWAETLFVSRAFVFYSATLTGVGVYLIGIGVGGFLIREVGGQWGPSIQIVYLVAALLLLAYVLSSTRLKAQFRVFISKHFYRNRYDYRDEWLRLIRTLSDSKQGLPLDQRSLKALADIVGSQGGQLWLDREGRGVYEPFSAWQEDFPRNELRSDSALVRFLRDHQWVIDSAEYEEDPEHYQHAFGQGADSLPLDSLMFPLMQHDAMLGIVRLRRPSERRSLNFEDHDLLKTAGRQVAAFLAHDLTRERLSETQQFEAFNKLSAFVMHDLKNVLSQQALLVNNAKKFHDRPEFIDDVIRTVDSGVQRMRRLLRQLEQGAPATGHQRVELNKLILRVVSASSDGTKTQCAFVGQAPIWVTANAEQLASVLLHLIQNAQEATTRGGKVNIKLEATAGRARIDIQDDGPGMSEEFVRRTLFKPFQSTKGSSGMGIGAYQAREIVRGLGGEVTVTSEVGAGTTVSVTLPTEHASAQTKESVQDSPT
jgi:putative PEP-CTERM system histidine kinase